VTAAGEQCEPPMRTLTRQSPGGRRINQPVMLARNHLHRPAKTGARGCEVRPSHQRQGMATEDHGTLRLRHLERQPAERAGLHIVSMAEIGRLQFFGDQRVEAAREGALDLAQAMRQNPNLKVYSLNGIYDMATPFFGTEYDITHMQLDPALRPNVRFAYYPSGHMVYLNEAASKTMKADLAKFYDDAR